MADIECDHASRKGVLLKDYAPAALDKTRLGQLISEQVSVYPPKGRMAAAAVDCPISDHARINICYSQIRPASGIVYAWFVGTHGEWNEKFPARECCRT